MRNVFIAGAGQSGLQLAIGLLEKGYDVTVATNRTPEEVATGKVLSSQCMFNAAHQMEEDLHLNLFDDQCPPVEGMSFVVGDPERGGKAIEFSSRLSAPAQSVDQRVKMPAWMSEFEARGGKLLINDVGIDELEAATRHHDLVLVAAGKGEIAKLFPRDDSRSPYDSPQRALALTYVTGMEPRPEYSAVCFSLLPGVGELLVFPALTTTGPCEIMVFQGIPGGPMDCWHDVSSPAEHLSTSLEIAERFFPWQRERCDNVALTDANGILTGRVTPTVRHPVATLPSGALVLGVADVVVLNDPFTGQGSNSASKCAASYLDSIVSQRDQPFDRAFMQSAFDRFWAYAQSVTEWTNALLGPVPPHVIQLLAAAQEHHEIAQRLVDGFDDPRDFSNWFMSPESAQRYLSSFTS